VAQQSIFCKQNTIKLSIVDAGVNYDFPLNTNLISAKMGWEHSLFARPSHEAWNCNCA
jgi:nicotinate-nucleotide--dimethylbenzimidazole phosphoribosyltransferase